MLTPTLHKNVADREHPTHILKPTAVEGTPSDSTLVDWSSENGKLSAGTWECTPGVFQTERIGSEEVIYIVHGRGALVGADGSRIEHAAGDLVHIPDGFKGEWHVFETLRKVYFGSSN